MNRRLPALLLTAIGVGFVGAQLLAAAADTTKRGRENGCRALSPDPLPAALKDVPAPDFSLPDPSGKPWTLAGLRGRPVLLNFWATWCPPCVEEMPSMEALANRLGDRAVVLAISVDEDWDVVKKFFAHGTTLSLLLDKEKAVSKRYGSEKFPETFLIDRDGRVRHYFINKRDWAMHEAELCIESLL